MGNKELFKVGDTVYHYNYGKGEIVKTKEANPHYPVAVIFEDGTRRQFTLKGEESSINKAPSLSFTPYDLVNGGFSQVKPLPDIEVDTLVYVRDSLSKEWKMRYFSHFDDSGMINCFLVQDKYKDRAPTIRWMEWSLANPLEEK